MFISEDLEKKFAQLRSKAGQSGQAVVEYILVLVVTVSIVLGIMHQFSDAFGSFLDKYFGDYIACLLESGELPSLGGQGASQSSCQSPMQNFDISAGKALVNSGSGGGSNGSSRSGDSSSDGDGSGSDSNSSNSSSNRPSRVTKNGGTANGEGRSANTQKGRPGRFNQKLNQSLSKENQDKNVGFNGSGGGSGGVDGKTIRKKTIIYLSEEYVSEDEKKKKKQSSAREISEKKDRNENELRAPLMKLEIKKTRQVSSEEEKTGFNFGALFKFLLIGGIIIAIFVFLGGQGVQIKKSWQKSE